MFIGVLTTLATIGIGHIGYSTFYPLSLKQEHELTDTETIDKKIGYWLTIGAVLLGAVTWFANGFSIWLLIVDCVAFRLVPAIVKYCYLFKSSREAFNRVGATSLAMRQATPYLNHPDDGVSLSARELERLGDLDQLFKGTI